jgi:hypothetical protein
MWALLGLKRIGIVGPGLVCHKVKVQQICRGHLTTLLVRMAWARVLQEVSACERELHLRFVSGHRS